MNTFKFISRARHLGCTLVLLAALQAQAVWSAVFPIEILQQEGRLTNTVFAYDGYGRAVSISGDTAVVGALQRVNVLQRQSGTWTSQGILTRPGTFNFGSAVAIAGNRLVVGDSEPQDGLGAVYVYERSSEPGWNAWNITDGDSAVSSANYYVTVTSQAHSAARANGWRYRLVARFLDDFETTPSMVFLYSDGVTRYGAYLDLNNSGNLVADLIGALPEERILTTNQNGATAYHVHELAFNPNSQMVTYYFDGRAIHTWAGQIQGGVNVIAWGSFSTVGLGAMNVHQAHFEILQTGTVLGSYDAGTAGNPQIAPDPRSQGWFQTAANGTRSPVGSLSPDFASVWREQARLTPSDGASGDLFGRRLALSGDTIVVGAPSDDDGGTDTGSAYVFVRNGSNWVQQQKLAPSVRASADHFGWHVAIDGDTIVVGAPYRSAAGGAFVFTRNGTIWTQQALLTASDGAPQDAFGAAVAVHGNRIAISAEWDDHAPSAFAGSVYVFDRTGSAWSQTGAFFATNTPPNEGFGNSLAMQGDAIVVGGFYYGAHWVYTRSATGWSQVHYRAYPDTVDPAVHDVAIDGETFIVGVAGTENESGAAYVYGPDFSNVAGVTQHVRKQLYYPDAKSSGTFDPNTTAFRYKHLLYGQTNGGIRARFENMAALYGPAERQRANEAEAAVLRSLSLNPNNAALGNLLLDLYYCRTEAEAIIGRNLATQAEAAHFGSPIAAPPDSGRFIIDKEIPFYRDLLVTNRFALQGYFNLLQREIEVQILAGSVTRWATQVLGFSSQWTDDGAPNWYAIQALGMPNTYPDHGDIDTAWASATQDDQREFLELGYDIVAPINSVSIYETYNPGAVDKISVRSPNTGQWQEVWTGTAMPAGNTARVFTVTFPLTSFPVSAIRIDLNSPAVGDWNEIDAVSISGPSDYVDSNFGQRLFQTLVPGRGLTAATYTDANGQNIPVTANANLFAGYKDLVLLFDLLREHGRAAETLGRLLRSRNGPGDLAEAGAVVSGAQRFLLLQGNLLKGMFATLPPPEDSSGLAQAIAGWSAGIESLINLSQAIAGSENPLGFAPDFLMLVENFFGVQDHFDSFDSFAERLEIGPGSSVLQAAKNALTDARTAYGAYRGFESELAEQFDESTTSLEFRLFQIVGVFPGEEGYGEDPTLNPGSELDQQARSIELARLRIQKNQTDISNLNEEVQIEQSRAAAVQEITIRYGNQQASLTEEIGRINAAQAAANQLTDYFNPANLVSGASIAIAVNFGVQTVAELEKGELQAQKERLGALEQSEIIGAESAARVKTLLLRMNTLLLDSKEAGLLLQQEWARLTGLYGEKHTLEAHLSERRVDLASRYFADPVHRLASQSSMVDADLDFEEARAWMFFMTRAFEYKWNESFTNSFRGRFWNADSVFKVRNADELVDLYDALVDRNDRINRGRQPETSWFSLREDHFGYKEGTDAQGRPLRYLDPDTGELVPAIEAFRRQLRRNTRLIGNGEEIVIEFSTVREIPGENFFLPATFDTNGVVIPSQRGSYLDKIDGLHIRLPGAHTLGRVDVPGTLTYGGTSFIRKPRVGTFDPVRPDRLRNELTAYSTRYWFEDSDLVWRFIDSFSSPVTMTLSTGPRMVTTAEEIVVFKERSVATTGWVLSLRTRTGTTQLLKIDELTDIELLFRHSSISRLQ